MSEALKTTGKPFAYRLVHLAACCLLLSACEQSLTLQTKSDVPAPLVTQLPLHIGVYYKDEFRNYTYTENSEDRQNWSIASGTSQVALFDQVLPSMFVDISHVKDLAGGDDMDAVLVPQVEEMQFALPHETKSTFYEAWIKYKIGLYDERGRLIAEWPLTGYGKSSTAFLKSRDQGMLAAVNAAFRDIGAKLSLGFVRVNAVRQWLAGKPEICRRVTDLC